MFWIRCNFQRTMKNSIWHSYLDTNFNFIEINQQFCIAVFAWSLSLLTVLTQNQMTSFSLHKGFGQISYFWLFNISSFPFLKKTIVFIKNVAFSFEVNIRFMNQFCFSLDSKQELADCKLAISEWPQVSVFACLNSLLQFSQACAAVSQIV